MNRFHKTKRAKNNTRLEPLTDNGKALGNETCWLKCWKRIDRKCDVCICVLRRKRKEKRKRERSNGEEKEQRIKEVVELAAAAESNEPLHR